MWKRLCGGAALSVAALAVIAFAQSDRGTITGTVTDSTQAVVAGANVTATSSTTGAQFKTVSTTTGNYTIPGLPSGVFDLSVEVAGFKKFTQKGITTQIAQTMRVDVVLEVGALTDSVTVTADAALLKTEGAEQSTTLRGDNITALPMNSTSALGGSIRNPWAFVSLSPGAYLVPTSVNEIRVNGLENTFKLMFDGMDSTMGNHPGIGALETQPSVEVIQEFTLQSSNFSAEFGQVAGGMISLTGRSGTNQFHGVGYEYLVNEFLNAGQPFTDNGNGQLIRSKNRKHDFGGAIGGPVWIPKVYNGHDKTFFFFNFEEYYQRQVQTGTFLTLPTTKMRAGDFSQILTGRVLGTDPLGRSILENAIYDPKSDRVVNGLVVRDPFPGNIIPSQSIDPVAAKIQALFPAVTNSQQINNFLQVMPVPKTQRIPSVKIDQMWGSKMKTTFYWSEQTTDYINGADGLPAPLTRYRVQNIYSHTFRLNHDYTVTPTLLLHAGIGYIRYLNPDSSPDSVLNYDAVGQLGYTAGVINGMPRIDFTSATFGGFSGQNLGPTNANKYYNDKPTAVLNATLVRNNHTFKAGGEFRIDIWTDRNTRGSSGVWTFGPTESGLPSTAGQNLQGGVTGNPYASFLMGRAQEADFNTPQDPQLRKKAVGLFIQDSWKITRKLTLDYGLRWDYQTAPIEIHHRTAAFDPKMPNPSAGGLLGATTYEGYGPGECNCTFAKTYPYAIGPRLGFAYQIDAKTVLRGGWGISYGNTAITGYITNTPIVGTGGYNELFLTPPAYGFPAAVLGAGKPWTNQQMYGTQYNPGIYPIPGGGALSSPPYLIDNNGGRPPRINQWNISLQRQITPNLVLEGAYVGNRSVWNTGAGEWANANVLVDFNALTPQRIRSFGLDITKPADWNLLTSPMNSPQVLAAGFKLPYAGFPTSLTLAQALRPFPQFGYIPDTWAPLGNGWYDALQTKLTKRFSHGLTAMSSFTWEKEQMNPANNINDVFNRANQKSYAPYSQPFVLVTSFTYTVPQVGSDKWVRRASGGWTLAGVMRYSSGLPIASPSANNNLSAVLFRGTFANRVPGQPLFLKDLNCHCFDPNKTFVLNPAAWSDPAQGQWGTAAEYYNDYRYARTPDEQLSLGRLFNMREGMTLEFRVEFFNPFNRLYLNQPASGNALATQVKDANGTVISGFGQISTGSTASAPRSGQLIVKFRF